MTNTTTINAEAPDESGKAIRKITEAIYLDGVRISHATARLIAAAMHSGPGSALERLASTGQFDAAILRRELAELSLQPYQLVWRDALLGYLNGIRADHPWTRPVVIPRDFWRRPRPTRPEDDTESGSP